MSHGRLHEAAGVPGLGFQVEPGYRGVEPRGKGSLLAAAAAFQQVRHDLLPPQQELREALALEGVAAGADRAADQVVPVAVVPHRGPARLAQSAQVVVGPQLPGPHLPRTALRAGARCTR
ncbi:hypothetical protein Shyd_18700 [Streptomyces hydrogenans]|uniref:Uncharacterized protein n=1 Tax=Streptomyces hydrogenans TaxID=1873719 RepID=A0ABQ3P642_9ACTN|nr:hypothetical protein Shyd_18700 [Streptomyces hydrogenans]